MTEITVQKNPTINAIITDWRVPAITWENTSWPKDVFEQVRPRDSGARRVDLAAGRAV